MTTTTTEAPKLAYSIEEAGEQLGGLSRRSVYELFDSGELRSVKVRRRRIVRHEHLVEYLNRQEGET